MTIPTPRAALTQLLARLDETTDTDGPVPAWIDSYCTAVQALKAEPEGEGPSTDDIRQLCVDNELLMFVDSSDSDAVVTAILEIAHAVLARWGTAVTPPSPNKEPGEAFNSASIDELRERTRRKYDRFGLPVPKHFTMNEERRDA